MAVPKQTSPAERRRYPRAPAPVLVRCHPIEEAEFQVQSISRDISVSGIRFPATEQLRGGSLLELTIELLPDQPPIHAQGEIKWLREFSRIGAPQFEVGVEFTDMSADDRHRLKIYCARWLKSGAPQRSSTTPFAP